jgi:serine/threonine-protein kinase RsbW
VNNCETKRFSNSASEIRRMSSWWCDWTCANGLSADARERGEICLNEVAANILVHGTVNHRATKVEISLDVSPDRVEMTIADDGEHFDPLAYPSPTQASSLADMPIGGFGIPLIRNFADDISYRRVNACNVLTLTFARHPHPPKSAPHR